MSTIIGIKTAEDQDAQLSSFFDDKYIKRLVIEDNTYMVQISDLKNQWEENYKPFEETFNRLSFIERKKGKKERGKR